MDRTVTLSPGQIEALRFIVDLHRAQIVEARQGMIPHMGPASRIGAELVLAEQGRRLDALQTILDAAEYGEAH